jgi:Ca-activated chloride channel family protein
MRQLYFFLLFTFFLNTETFAFNFQNLWITKDQEAASLMKKGKYAEAQSLFENLSWQAVAAYRAEDYKQAAKQFADLQTEEGFYNLGNALAKLGKLEQAIEAYDKTLAINPEHQDAKFNKELVKKLLENQPPQQNENNNQQRQQEQQNQSPKNQDSQQQTKQEPNPKDNPNNKLDEQKKSEKEKSSKKAKQNNKEEQESKNKQQMVKADQDEAQRAKDQWLHLIPDDPGGLLRQKFLRDHLRRKKE